MFAAVWLASLPTKESGYGENDLKNLSMPIVK